MASVRAHYEQSLLNLQNDVLVLGSMVDRAIDRAINALRHLDHDEARAIIQDDLAINEKRYAIEAEAIQLIARQQPMARDLRTIVAVLHVVVELERMGDYAEGIAKIALMHGAQPLLKPLVDIPQMAEMARSMLQRSLQAFIRQDLEAAKAIAAEDDAVDALYDHVYHELIRFMINDPSTIDRATWLLWVSHNLERIADRVTNICERVAYEVTGRLTEMNVSKY